MLIFVETQVSANLFLRIIGGSIDRRKINRYRERLTIILDKFEVLSFNLYLVLPPAHFFFCLDSIQSCNPMLVAPNIGRAKRIVQSSDSDATEKEGDIQEVLSLRHVYAFL